ncbi:ABC transporter [Microbacterium sp. Root61]|uniref:hypothetical protein n=1 Tax=Microbacterium sp. Root61 TaxID=1736570 RepID=UPI0006F37975|nr:hypothetical protein [Microbacterium sp. Root61]KRA25623.1 ABC transporter [Microbacterium sp. Root61]
MSDPKSSYGEPVEEPTDVDDVVGRAHEGLADAEAAGREAVVADAAAAQDAATDAAEPVADAPAPDAAPATTASDDYDPSIYETAAALTPVDETPTVVVAEPVVTPSEPVYDEVVYAAPAVIAAAQPIFVQAPEAPRPRGNRAAAGAIGLLAAVAFAILYLGAALGFGAISGEVTAENVGTVALTALSTWSLWVPVVVFFLAFWLLGAIINRGRWGIWVITGLLVGVAAYGGHILGALFEAPFWMLTASQGVTLVEGQLLAPLAIAAFVFGRELTIWFGAWVAARGKRVTELNIEAQREYERTLEAGPQLVRQ